MNSAKLSGQWGAFTIMGFNCFHISSVHPIAKLPKYPEQCLRYFGHSNVQSILDIAMFKVFWTEQCSKYFGHSNVQSMTEQFSIYFWQSVKVFIVGLFNSFHLSRSVKFCKTPFSQFPFYHQQQGRIDPNSQWFCCNQTQLRIVDLNLSLMIWSLADIPI